jgi:hypothetical protein
MSDRFQGVEESLAEKKFLRSEVRGHNEEVTSVFTSAI